MATLSKGLMIPINVPQDICKLVHEGFTTLLGIRCSPTELIYFKKSRQSFLISNFRLGVTICHLRGKALPKRDDCITRANASARRHASCVILASTDCDTTNSMYCLRALTASPPWPLELTCVKYTRLLRNRAMIEQLRYSYGTGSPWSKVPEL